MENASYIENNLMLKRNWKILIQKKTSIPQNYFLKMKILNKIEEDPQNERLFDQNSSDDEEFEIPAFLRNKSFNANFD